VKTINVKFRPVVALIAVIATMMAGCASLPLASETLDKQAKEFKPVPDKAVVYIYRKNSRIYKKAVKFPIAIDGHNLGEVKTGTFFRVELEPGVHDIWVLKSDTFSSVSRYSQKLEANQQYFLRNTMKNMTFKGHSKLTLTRADEAKNHIRECQLLIAKKRKGPALYN